MLIITHLNLQTTYYQVSSWYFSSIENR